MPHDPYGALYVHVPFCVKRCLYCDFATQAAPRGSAVMDDYVERTLLDIRRASREGELAAVRTVYLGGGTPTHLGLGPLSQLLTMLGVSMCLEGVEFSMEANPESLTPAIVRDSWALGVNRLSLGVQSFDDAVLATLGRVHDADRAAAAVDEAHERFENVSLDLMCGIPGQSVESLAASVRRAVELGVTHVSVYPLTIEPGTPMAKLVRRGKLPAPDEDAEAAHMEAAEELLADAGFARYEVASYARPGFECRHNTAYWTGVPYLGIGQSAVTMTQLAGTHRMRVQDGQVTDDLDARQMAAEDLMLGMRLSRGLADAQVAAAEPLLPDVRAVLGRLRDQGLVTREGDAWVPTHAGWLCGNDLYGALFDLAP